MKILHTEMYVGTRNNASTIDVDNNGFIRGEKVVVITEELWNKISKWVPQEVMEAEHPEDPGEYTCPLCDAPPAKLCRMVDGNFARTYHFARLSLADRFSA